MRIRRRLADNFTISVCAVLIAVSAFFYAPMEVRAEESLNLSEEILVDNLNIATDEILKDFNVSSSGYQMYYGSYVVDVGLIDFSQFVTSNSELYKVEYDLSCYTSPYGGVAYTSLILVPSEDFDGTRAFFPDNLFATTNTGFSESLNMTDHVVKYIPASDLSRQYTLVGYYFSNYVSTFSFDLDISFKNVIVESVSSNDSEDYQNGYNDGYSAGEQAGYGNGYSNGFADGEASVDTGAIYDEAFQDGKDSVDTQSFYDAGYQAGYQVAYSAGYSNGFAEGLKSAQDSPGEWQRYNFIGSPISNVKKYGSSFYIAPYGLDDMEEYQNGSNGYYHNTVPSVYDGYSTINYLIPFDSVTKIDADSFLVEMTLSNLFSGFDINTGSGAFQNSLVSSEVQEVYLTFNGRKYFGNIGKYTSGSQGYVNFSFIVEDVIPPVELNGNCMALTFVIHNTMFANINASQYKFVGASCSPYVSFNVGSTAQGYAFRVRPFIKNDRVSANIQNQTDNLTNGFNDSKGNSVNNVFLAGLNEFETAEDSLFATATSGIKDFTFFDINSVPAMLTGMSFVGSIMSGWFNQAGGVSGVGIVLSILFSIMLVAMVLGLYRWYQSKGGKD